MKDRHTLENLEKLVGKGSEWQIPVALTCILLGIIISIQFKTMKSQNFPLISQREDLAKMVRYLEIEKNKLQNELTATRDNLNKLENTSAEGKSMVTAMKEQLEQMRIQAGLMEMEGPGISIRLADSPVESPDDPTYYIVHDVDLSTLVNELWASGAECISINDQRIVNGTPIRCAGPVILVNSEKVISPYIVKAIGPPANLEAALRMPGGFMSSMALSISNGVEIRITRSDSIKIPAYKGSLTSSRYGKPVKEKGEK